MEQPDNSWLGSYWGDPVDIQLDFELTSPSAPQVELNYPSSSQAVSYPKEDLVSPTAPQEEDLISPFAPQVELISPFPPEEYPISSSIPQVEPSSPFAPQVELSSPSSSQAVSFPQNHVQYIDEMEEADQLVEYAPPPTDTQSLNEDTVDGATRPRRPVQISERLYEPSGYARLQNDSSKRPIPRGRGPGAPKHLRKTRLQKQLSSFGKANWRSYLPFREKNRVRKYWPVFILFVSVAQIAMMITELIYNGGFESFSSNPFGGPSSNTLLRLGAKWAPYILYDNEG
jgi:hypothetical protein